MTSRPNLVFVFADQLRHGSLGYAGDAQARTPYLDRFARQGVDFQNTVTSHPVCAAYRATLFTGRHLTSHGMVINDLRLHPNQRCFGHVVTAAGYQTGYIGKWHLYANQFGNHHAPDCSFVPRGPHRLGFDGDWLAYNFHHTNYGAYHHTESPAKIPYGDGVYEPDAQTDLAIGFLERAAAGPDPFTLFLSYGPPHDPWDKTNVPEKFWEMFRDVPFPNPPNYRPQNDEPYVDNWARLTDAERGQLESWRRGYYAQVASLDECFGRVLAALDRLNLAENTIVVFTSDHGEMFGAHGRRAKNIFYDEACRVPMLLRWPGRIPAGHRSDACLATVDIMPTLLALLGQPAEDVEGMDLSHLALGRPGPEPAAALLQICGATAVWEDGHEWRALRDKRYTYAIYRVDGRELLFDNRADPWQMHDLTRDPAHHAVRDHFRQMLAGRMAELNDTFESCTWYRDHWTDGHRNIVRSATRDFEAGKSS